MKRVASIQRQLDGILGSRAKLSALRVLHDGRPSLNAREIARRAGLAHRSAQLALASLSQTGIVTMRAMGNNHLFSLNSAFHLYDAALAAAFEAERVAAHTLALDIVRTLRGIPVVTVAWFGSAARGERTPSSDIDVLVVLPDSRAMTKARQNLEENASSFVEKYGFRLEPHLLGAGELARRFDADDPLVRNMVKDAVLLHGKPLPEVLRDAA